MSYDNKSEDAKKMAMYKHMIIADVMPMVEKYYCEEKHSTAQEATQHTRARGDRYLRQTFRLHDYDIKGLTPFCRLVEQPGDGSCLFHTLGFTVDRDHTTLRREICDWLDTNWEDGFDEALQDGICEPRYNGLSKMEKKRRYIADMRKHGKSAGEFEIIAFTRIYKKNVYLYDAPAEVLREQSVVNLPITINNTIILHYIWEGERGHYSNLIPMDESAFYDMLSIQPPTPPHPALFTPSPPPLSGLPSTPQPTLSSASQQDDRPDKRPDNQRGDRPDNRRGDRPDNRPGARNNRRGDLPDNRPGAQNNRRGELPDNRPGERPDNQRGKRPDDRPGAQNNRRGKRPDNRPDNRRGKRPDNQRYELRDDRRGELQDNQPDNRRGDHQHSRMPISRPDNQTPMSRQHNRMPIYRPDNQTPVSRPDNQTPRLDARDKKLFDEIQVLQNIEIKELAEEHKMQLDDIDKYYTDLMKADRSNILAITEQYHIDTESMKIAHRDAIDSVKDLYMKMYNNAVDERLSKEYIEGNLEDLQRGGSYVNNIYHLQVLERKYNHYIKNLRKTYIA